MPKRLDEEYSAGRVGTLTPAVWDNLLRTIELRFKRQEDREPSLDAALESLLEVGLNRIDETLAPAILSINEVAQLGFLIAQSATSHALSIGVINTWIVPAGPIRRNFAPGPLSIIQRTGDHDVWAILETQTYQTATGAYAAKVIAMSAGAVAEPGPYTDWVIGAPAGSTLAQMAMLEEGKAARATTLASAAQVALDREAVAEDREYVASVADAIEAGPVLSVNGVTGAVVITAAGLGAAPAASTDERLDVLEAAVPAIEAAALTRRKAVALSIAYGG